MATLNLPPNSRPLYRIMALKSRFMFGKYPDLMVSDVLKVDISYIAYCYYCLPHISFKDEILTEAGITKKIDKPGTSEELFSEWKKVYSSGFSEEQRMHGRFVFIASRKRHDKARLIQAQKDASFSKGQLQAINHGHMKGAK